MGELETRRLNSINHKLLGETFMNQVETKECIQIGWAIFDNTGQARTEIMTESEIRIIAKNKLALKGPGIFCIEPVFRGAR